jgi:ankyrin repeat protein
MRLPTGLGSTFESTIGRINTQKCAEATQAIEVLKWTFLVRWPLTVEQMRHALAVSIPADKEDDRYYENLDWNNRPSEKSLVNLCLGLVVIDEETSTLRLVHKSLYDYLIKQHDLGKIFQEGHAEIAHTCLTYMQFKDSEYAVNATDTSKLNPIISILKRRLKNYPLLRYAMYNWGHHARHQTTPAVESLADNLFLYTLNSECISMIFRLVPMRVCGTTQYLYQAITKRHGYQGLLDMQSCFGLHVAAYFGLQKRCEMLIEDRSYDVNRKDCDDFTALSVAALHGQTEIVRSILTRPDIDVNVCDNFGGRTALGWATFNGHNEVVCLLFERPDIDLHQQDLGCGDTAFLLAVRRGRKKVVRLFLERAREKIDINRKNNHDDTPLLLALKAGHFEIVRLLLTHNDICINLQDKSGHTALSIAARNGLDAIVRLLLKKNKIDVNLASADGKTPLSYAAIGNHSIVMRLLLEREDIQLNLRDLHHEKTPLSMAADMGNESVVRLLLDRENTNINNRDSNGDTALSSAVYKGHTNVVRLLLQRSDIDIHCKNSYDQTVLSLAAENGYKEIARLLLERDDIDLNPADDNGSTPLLLAAYKGYCSIVSLLLAEDGVDINAKSTHGQTALSLAAEEGHEAIVGLLLERKEQDINQKDNDGDTPLILAAKEGHDAIVRLLLECDGVDIYAENTKGQSVLSLASQKRHYSIVKQLRDKGAGMMLKRVEEPRGMWTVFGLQTKGLARMNHAKTHRNSGYQLSGCGREEELDYLTVD